MHSNAVWSAISENSAHRSLVRSQGLKPKSVVAESNPNPQLLTGSFRYGSGMWYIDGLVKRQRS